jgi:hypothetical protein
MPVTINGTSGVVSPDGSAGTPAYQGSDANTGMFFPAADTIAFAEGGAEVMRIDSSGNVGVGVTPSAWFASNKAIQIGSTGAVSNYTNGSNIQTFLANNVFWNAAGTISYITTNTATSYTQDNGTHKWYYAASGTAGNAITFTQAMTLDSSGNLLVGKTAVDATAAGCEFGTYGAVLTRNGDALLVNRQGSDGTAITIRRSNTTVGTISVTTSATAYNTSSDYRLKENIAPMTGALAKVAALKPVTYKWKADGSAGEGFIAHELAEVCPDAVSGEKDAVDEDGNIKPQGIDTSFLVATLTAAIQEQQALITSLTARIAALEGAQ